MGNEEASETHFFFYGIHVKFIHFLSLHVAKQLYYNKHNTTQYKKNKKKSHQGGLVQEKQHWSSEGWTWGEALMERRRSLTWRSTAAQIIWAEEDLEQIILMFLSFQIK